MRYFLLLSMVLFTTSCHSGNKGQLSGSNSGIVNSYGQLKVKGTLIVNEHGDTVALHGMSMFWSQWMGKYYNSDCIEWLVQDWKCDVIRAAIGVEGGGYIEHPKREMRKLRKVVDACIDQGIYVIVDWHAHYAENHPEIAVDFFTAVAREYGSYPNIIYEIYNEPLMVSWDSVIRPYSENVIAAIRAYDPDNLIIAGTSQWSQNVDEASLNPLDDDNTAYAVHFYAGTHKQWLRDKCDTAMKNGIALFVSEFGTCNSDGNGPIDYAELEKWFTYMDENNMSWCNWSVADKKETASILKPGGSRHGNWSDDDLTESGKLIRKRLRK